MLALIIAALTMIYPLIWMVVSSFRPSEMIFRQPGLVFDNFTLDNYTHGWTALNNSFDVFLINSAVIEMLSPGITISVPSAKVTIPVTSVVRK